MKKQLLIAGASLLLLSGLTAGVFAQYTTNIDNAGSGNVNTKTFVLLQEGTAEQDINFILAPGESDTTSITVKNFDDSGISQTAMNVAVSVETNDVTGTLSNYLSFNLDNANFEFDANSKSTKTVTLTVSLDEDATNDVIGWKTEFTIKVVGTQKVAA